MPGHNLIPSHSAKSTAIFSRTCRPKYSRRALFFVLLYVSRDYNSFFLIVFSLWTNLIDNFVEFCFLMMLWFSQRSGTWRRISNVLVLATLAISSINSRLRHFVDLVHFLSRLQFAICCKKSITLTVSCESVKKNFQMPPKDLYVHVPTTIPTYSAIFRLRMTVNALGLVTC